MAVVMGSDVHARKKKLSEYFVRYGNRSLTDIGGFGIVVFLQLFMLNPVLIKNGYLLGDHSTYERRRNLTIEAKELWKNYNYTNASNNNTQLFGLITRLLKTEELISGFNVWHLKDIVVGVVCCCVSVRAFPSAAEIMCKMIYDLETTVHFAIIDATRIIAELSFFCAMYFQSTGSWSLLQYMSHWLFFPNFCTLFAIFFFILAFFVKLIIIKEPLSTEDTETLKNTFRFYVARCYLLLFRCIILVLMVLCIICVTISLKDLLDQSSSDIIFFIVASVYIVLCLHTFGELVIMTATASHNWDQHQKAISLKSLLWAIAIVSRYHLGSVFFGTFFAPTFMMMDKPQKLRTSSNTSDRCHTKHTLTRLSRMFIAVLGQSHGKAEQIIFTRFVKKRQPSPVVKSASTQAWEALLECSTIFRLVAWLLLLHGSSLAVKLSMICVYLAIAGSVSYVITAIDIVESTIQFGNMEGEGFDEDEDDLY